MQIFFDFDDVLFDTGAFTRDFKKAFVHELNISPHDFDTSYQKARQRRGITNYSYQRHVRILSHEYHVEEKDIHRVMTRFTRDVSRYVFADVPAGLEALLALGHELFLVTFGSPTLQKRKLHGSGIEQYFKDQCVGEIAKADAITALQKTHGRKTAVYCEDRREHLRAVLARHRTMQGILMMRASGRYRQQGLGEAFCRELSLEGKACKQAQTMNDVLRIIAEYGG